MPANDDLRDSFAVLLGKIPNDFLIEHGFTALSQRAPGFGLNFVRGVPGVQLTLLHEWVQLNLVDHWRNAGFINQTLQMMDLEITDPDALHQPLLLQVDQPFPRLDVMIDGRNRPVHQIEINEIELEFFQTFQQGFARAFLVVVPQFGGDE
ncbi:hypothetical protein D3C86_1519090 [compost metagenome]